MWTDETLRICEILGAVAAFLLAFWRTGIWFGKLIYETQANNRELHGIRQDLESGFTANDSAHLAINDKVEELRDTLAEHGTRLAVIERVVEGK